MKLLYRVIDATNNELYKGDKNQVTSWLADRSDNSGLIVVKVGGSREYTVDEFLSNMVPLTMKYSIVADFGTDTGVLFSSSSKDRIVDWLKARNDVRGMMVIDNEGAIGDRTKTVEDFLRQNIILEIYSQLVPKYYTMDPETEDMLPNGRHLANGMQVLIADPDNRERPEKLGVNERGVSQDWLKQKLLDRNRWCTVSHIEITNDGKTVSFIGIYEDGVKSKYTMGVSHAWLVKTDSIADSLGVVTERVAQIQDLVQDVMTTVVKVVTGEASDDEKADQLTDTIRKTTTQILGIIG